MKSLIALAMRQAEKVEIYKRWNTTFRLGAVLFRKNNVINTGRNYPKKTHPRSTSPYKTLHAEMDAILSVPRFLTEGASLLVVRLDMLGNLVLSKPCSDCYGLIKSVGIKKVFYTNNERGIDIIKVK